MIIRQASETDIPEIVELLKVSLGESMIPKSEALWKWKHFDNPFGQSPVLLAEEDGNLCGVRAFLRWEYLENGKILKACRAVDTATHPDYQGRGIFKKLTLSLIEEIKKQDIDLIYNTPNTNSTPGYLKMGWEKWGKLPLKLNFHLTKSKSKLSQHSEWNEISELVDSLEDISKTSSGSGTHLIPGYLHWRYRDNPLFPYQFISDGKEYLLIYRVKEGKMGREFRICDFFTAGELSEGSKKNINNVLNKQIQTSGCRFSSYSGLSFPKQKILDLGMVPIMKIGPVVTLRNVRDEDTDSLTGWDWSLGDLEVF